MKWQFSADAPIYTQLVAQIQMYIVSGALPPGERLPSVREFAAEAGVNPNTMQRAMAELEREGLPDGKWADGCMRHHPRFGGAARGPDFLPGHLQHVWSQSCGHLCGRRDDDPLRKPHLLCQRRVLVLAATFLLLRAHPWLRKERL